MPPCKMTRYIICIEHAGCSCEARAETGGVSIFFFFSTHQCSHALNGRSPSKLK